MSIVGEHCSYISSSSKIVRGISGRHDSHSDLRVKTMGCDVNVAYMHSPQLATRVVWDIYQIAVGVFVSTFLLTWGPFSVQRLILLV